jgi:uroporphyrinogen decarboxylase
MDGNNRRAEEKWRDSGMQSEAMKPRERIIAALERQPLTGRVPHFELLVFPTMEAFGKVHPSHRNYSQWGQMEAKEQQMHREEMADIYIATAERFEHSAIVIRPNPYTVEEIIRMVDILRDRTGDKYFIMCPSDATFSIPDGNRMVEFSVRIVDDMKGLKAEAEGHVNRVMEDVEKLAKHGGLDGFDCNSDYCFNTGPFLSPSMFSELVTPYLAKLMQGFRDLGLYGIKHTDGNIMPIIDQLVEARPHALHSLDPQGGVDIAEVKKRYGDQVCLMGNVNCGLLDTGTDDEVVESARYALRHGMPGGGYIFSTSNCIYPGMRLARYELMLDVWRREGNYGPA